jgi:phosphopantetheinyl transferase
VGVLRASPLMGDTAEIAAKGLHGWEPGPARPSLEPGVVHVWRADLRTVDDSVVRWLSAAERRRAAGILNARKAQLWERSRAVLRELLGRYEAADPACIKLAVAPSGKLLMRPLADTREQRRGQLHFNLSHSAALALYAFKRDDPVGIDLEVSGKRIDYATIARRVSGSSEEVRLRALAPAEREREFLRLWTHHEACLKCGRVDTEPGPRTTDLNTRLWTATIDTGPGATAAIAVNGTNQRLRLFALSAQRGCGARL